MSHDIRIFQINLAGIELRCAEIDGVKLCNTTPHPATFGDESGVFGSIPTSGLTASATASASQAGEFGEVSLQRTSFEGNPENEAVLKALKAEGIVAFGSIIAMNAYPGLVYGLVPVKRFERVPPAEKRMQVKLFNIA